MNEYLEKYWLEFLEHEELTNNDFQVQLGNFWCWFQDKKLPKIKGYKVKKVVETNTIHRSRGEYTGGTRVVKI